MRCAAPPPPAPPLAPLLACPVLLLAPLLAEPYVLLIPVVLGCGASVGRDGWRVPAPLPSLQEDGLLLKAEAEAEGPLRARAIAEWEEREAERQASLAAVRGGMEDGEGGGGVGGAAEPAFVAYVPLPDQKEIEARVLESKKAALLNKYASESLQKEQQEARELLNRR